MKKPKKVLALLCAASMVATPVLSATAQDLYSQEQTVADTESLAEVTAFVERMYTVALGREADAAGCEFWRDLLLSGVQDGAGIAKGFILCDEFVTKGYDDETFVSVLYATFFDRVPVAEDLAFWVNTLEMGFSREYVISCFVNSQEFFDLCARFGISRGMMNEDGSAINPGIFKFSERLYVKILERSGEREGMEFWASAIANGTVTPVDAAMSFFTGPEYLGRNTTDEEYVEALYQTFMDREGEAGGTAFWLEVLGNGASRELALVDFANGKEFQNIVDSFFPSEEPENPEQPGDEKEPISFSIALPSTNLHEEENQWYDKLVADLNEYLDADITWEWRDTNIYYESLAMDMAAGELSDVRIVAKDYVFCDAVEWDAFWDLTDYIDEYDNLATIPWAVRENASINGRMYGIPRSRTLARNGMGYRVDWLNALGLKEPTDWDSFVEMLYAFTYCDPDGNGVNDTVGLFLDSWAGSWDIMMTWFGVPNMWGIDENGDLIHKSQTQEYKNAMDAFRELYEMGVINNGENGADHFTQIGAGMARNKGLREQIGGCGIQVLDDLRKVQTYFQDAGIVDSWDIVFTLQGAVDTGLGYLCHPTLGMNNLVVISKQNIQTEDQLREVLRVLNDMCDGECMNLVEFGWEGLTYELDEDGYIVRYDEIGLTQSGVGSWDYCTGFNQCIPYFTAKENARPVSMAPNPIPIYALEQQLYEENIQYCVPNYGASYTSETYVEVGVDLDTLLAEAQLAYILGEIDAEEFDAALDAWLEEGGAQVTAEMNEAFHASGR